MDRYRNDKEIALAMTNMQGGEKFCMTPEKGQKDGDFDLKDRKIPQDRRLNEEDDAKRMDGKD